MNNLSFEDFPFGIEGFLRVGAEVADSSVSPVLGIGARAVWHNFLNFGPEVYIGVLQEFNLLNSDVLPTAFTAGTGWNFM